MSIAAAALAAALSVPALAQAPGSQQTREFVQAAAQTDAFEILEATTVLAQSKNPQIRTFAQKMIQTHQQTALNLMKAVAQSGLQPPLPGINGDQSQFLAALQSLRGAEFDKAYINHQILVHRAALAVAQIYAASGDDPAIRQAAASLVPVIQSHLQMTNQMQSRSGTTAMTDG